MQTWATVVALVLATAVATGGRADDGRQQARRLADQAYVSFKEGRYEEAASLFEQADALHHAPTLMLWLARSYEKQGRLVKAEATYVKLISEPLPPAAPPEFARARQDATDERDAIAPRIPQLRVLLPEPIPADLTLSVDGRAVPAARLRTGHKIDPGTHELRARRPGVADVERNVFLGEGERLTVQLPMPLVKHPSAPSPAPAPEQDAATVWLPLGILGVSLAGAGAIVGGVAGGIALERRSALLERCPNTQCGPEDRPIHDEMTAAATASTVGFAVAGGAAALGTIFLIVDATEAADSSDADGVSVRVGPTGFNLEVTF